MPLMTRLRRRKTSMYLAVGYEVEIALPVACFCVAQAVILFRQWAHPLGDDDGTGGFDGYLAGPGAYQVALDSQVVRLYPGPSAVRKSSPRLFRRNSDLDGAGIVLKVKEGGPPHDCAWTQFGQPANIPRAVGPGAVHPASMAYEGWPLAVALSQVRP